MSRQMFLSVSALVVFLLYNCHSSSSKSHHPVFPLSSGAQERIFRRSLLSAKKLEISGHRLDNGTIQSAPGETLFPADVFSTGQRRAGAVALHVVGVVYMFVALALVCDEFFVPSLEVISHRLQISEDVAGATFMAAGGSAPELFTNIIGVFVAKNDVGIATIVGSAVFNILFVIAMCGLFSATVLRLSWWPLLRDVVFYSSALLALTVVFSDQQVLWWEAAILLLFYVLYCVLMKFNTKVEMWTKSLLVKCRIGRVRCAGQFVSRQEVPTLSQKETGIQSGDFRQGLLHLMIHSLDPLSEGTVDTKATQLHAIATLKVLLNTSGLSENVGQKEQEMISTGLSNVTNISGSIPPVTSSGGNSNQSAELTSRPLHASPATNAAPTSSAVLAESSSPVLSSNSSRVSAKGAGERGHSSSISKHADSVSGSNIQIHQPHEDIPLRQLQEPHDDISLHQELGNCHDWGQDNPTTLGWPNAARKRLKIVLIAPLVLLLRLTLPDCKTARGREHYILAFLGSIIWIGIFSYMMVWWAIIIAETIPIPPEVVGLTVLAAGTSIPDLITSVIVARKGLGDMAVSSSIGSNIFDICVGLPLPWLLSTMVAGVGWVTGGAVVSPSLAISVSGMACMVLLLFSMLILVVGCLACSGWRLLKPLAMAMLLLYFSFLAVALLFELSVVECAL